MKAEKKAESRYAELEGIFIGTKSENFSAKVDPRAPAFLGAVPILSNAQFNPPQKANFDPNALGFMSTMPILSNAQVVSRRQYQDPSPNVRNKVVSFEAETTSTASNAPLLLKANENDETKLTVTSLASNALQLSLTEDVPRIPPKPPSIRRKQKALEAEAEAKARAKAKHDYANANFQSGLKVTFNENVVERGMLKLAPKSQNKSMPNLARNATNPFYINETKSVNSNTNPFVSQKSPFKLGEDFFASLFTNTNPIATEKPLRAVPMGVSAAPPSSQPLAATKAGQGPVKAPTAPLTTQQDKYAALKDLDDIFKSTVTIQDGEFIFKCSDNLGMY